MKVNDHGFTERVATTAVPTTSAGRASDSRAAAGLQKSGPGTDVNLSGFAAKLSASKAADASDRAEHVSQVAKAVADGTFKIDTTAISHSLVSEGLQTKD